MKQTFTLSDKVNIGDYSVEYANFNIYIKKHGSLVRCIEKKRDFNDLDYTRFIESVRGKLNKK